jgi:hypothetical protein
MKRLLSVLTACLLCAASEAWAECNNMLKSSFDRSQVVVHDDGTLVDLSTGLMWQRCTLGYSWQSGTCSRDSAAAEFTWEDALTTAASKKTFAGYHGWRLPNKNELGSLVERACFSPAIDQTLFPATESKGYWTNTPNNFNEFSAWAVNFVDGDHMSTSRTNLLGIRLVRPVQ